MKKLALALAGLLVLITACSPLLEMATPKAIEASRAIGDLPVNGTYQIVNKFSNKAQKTDSYPGASVYNSVYTGATIQKWTLTQVGAYYRFINLATGHALKAGEYGNVNTENLDSGDDELFTLQHAGSGYFYVSLKSYPNRYWRMQDLYDGNVITIESSGTDDKYRWNMINLSGGTTTTTIPAVTTTTTVSTPTTSTVAPPTSTTTTPGTTTTTAATTTTTIVAPTTTTTPSTTTSVAPTTTTSTLAPTSTLQLQAENFANSQGITKNSTFVSYVDNNDWISFNGVNFGTNNFNSVLLRYASGGSGKIVEFRLDSVTGPLISSYTQVNTGGYGTYKSYTVSFGAASGVHALFIVFKGGDGVGNFDYFTFSGSGSTTTLPPVTTTTIATTTTTTILTTTTSSTSTTTSLPTVGTYAMSIPNPYETNVRSDSLIGMSTSSFSDTNLSTSSIAPIAPKFMRYYYGGTLVFDQNNIPNGIASIQTTAYPRNQELTQLMGVSTSDWKYTPALTFDEFIALCRANNTEPVVLLPIYAAYYTGSGAKMTRDQLYTAHENFIRYANITKGYNVKYWEIGNEDDLDPDNVSAQTYAGVFNELVPRLKAVDSRIECGANTFWDTNRWKTLLPLIKDTMGFAVIHQYSTFTTYDSFLNGSMATEIMVDRFNSAYNSLSSSSRPASNKVIVTEISSYSVSDPTNQYMNNTWKGLHNFQLLLDVATRSNVHGMTSWVSYYNNGLLRAFNVFADSSETTLSPVGTSLRVMNNHIYSNLGRKYTVSGSPVEIWVSHSTDRSKMSVFVLNKASSSSRISLSLSGFSGDPTKNKKWVYTGSSPTATTVSYQNVTTDVSSVGPVSVNLQPYSLTVYDFNSTK